MFDDIYSFDGLGNFTYLHGEETYGAGLSVYDDNEDRCAVLPYPWNGANDFTYNLNEQTNTLTVIGHGAYIALPNVMNGYYEVGNPSDAPSEITYTLTKINSDEILLFIDAHRQDYRFTLERVLGN